MKWLNKHIIPGLALCWALAAALTAECQFVITSNSYMTIKEGASLYVGTYFKIKSDATSSGYFVDQTINGDVIITGTKTVERYISPNKWHNVASPVSNESSSTFTGTDLVFWYNETLVQNDWNFGWVWYYGATGGPLQVFRGYDLYIPNNPQTINYDATAAQTLNTGAYTINITHTGSDPDSTHNSWNLVGNPYPSPVDWLANSGWNKTNINDAKYIWDGADSIYTIFIGGGAPIGINGGTQFIPSNQGFWVQALQTGIFGINNAVRVATMTGTPGFYKNNSVVYPLVSLFATGNNKSDEAVIRFIAGTIEGFDVNYDASKLFSPSPNVPQISIKAGNQILALNTLPELKDNLEVLLNFQCGKAGYYKIGLTNSTGLDLNTKVYLKDELEQTIINLTADSAYGFYHEPANEKNRFKIYFNPSADILNNITPESYFSVYAEKKIITILKNTVQHVSGEIAVYNMLGQPVCREILVNEDKSTIRVNLPTGYYIVSIITNQHIFNSKILISN